MATKHDLTAWVTDARRANDGWACIVQVCQHSLENPRRRVTVVSPPVLHLTVCRALGSYPPSKATDHACREPVAKRNVGTHARSVGSVRAWEADCASNLATFLSSSAIDDAALCKDPTKNRPPPPCFDRADAHIGRPRQTAGRLVRLAHDRASPHPYPRSGSSGDGAAPASIAGAPFNRDPRLR